MLFLVYVILLLVKVYGRMPMLEELFNQTKRRCKIKLLKQMLKFSSKACTCEKFIFDLPWYQLSQYFVILEVFYSFLVE